MFQKATRDRRVDDQIFRDLHWFFLEGRHALRVFKSPQCLCGSYGKILCAPTDIRIAIDCFHDRLCAIDLGVKNETGTPVAPQELVLKVCAERKQSLE